MFSYATVFVEDPVKYDFFFFTFKDGYTTEDLIFLWKEGDPVQVTANLHLPRFALQRFYTEYCTSKTNTGTNIITPSIKVK